MINWGIISTGKIANAFAHDFHYVPSGHLLAVASRSLDKAQAFAQTHQIPHAYGSYEALINDPNIQAIYIATPHHSHFELTLQCLNKGKAVLCEKPITVNSQQLQDLITTAKANDCFLMEAMWTYFLPPIVQVRKWIQEGRIGQVRAIKAEFGYKGKFDPKGRLFNPDLAGGALLDIGIYPISLATILFNQSVEHIYAVAQIGTTGVDEYNSILLTYPDGGIAELSSSLVNSFHCNAYIYGTEGHIHIPRFWQTKSAHLQNANERIHFEDQREAKGFCFETEAVNQLLLAGKKESDIASHARSLEVMQIMDEVRRQIGLRYPFE